MHPKDINRLVARAQKGDKDAFGEIYSLFLKTIFRFILFSVRRRELAEDLTQNTFFKAWRALASFSLSRGSFGAYLFAIARNLIIDYSRSKKELPLETIENYPSKEDPEQDFIRQEAKEVVWRSLGKLPKDERELIVLRFFEELKFREIGKIVGKDEVAVRVAIFRILKKLQKYLKEKYEN